MVDLFKNRLKYSYLMETYKIYPFKFGYGGYIEEFLGFKTRNGKDDTQPLMFYMNNIYLYMYVLIDYLLVVVCIYYCLPEIC